MTSVVLVSASPAVVSSTPTGSADVRAALTAVLGGCRITLVAPHASTHELPADERIDVRPGSSRADAVLSRAGVAALDRALRRTPVGRVLSSLGPMSAGRVLRRAVHADALASAALADADVVIALEPDAALVAWDASRRGARAFSGLGPALAVLARRD